MAAVSLVVPSPIAPKSRTFTAGFSAAKVVVATASAPMKHSSRFIDEKSLRVILRGVNFAFGLLPSPKLVRLRGLCMSEILVIGHRNPDTDAICSAIGYAEFKRRTGMAGAVAARCGDTNDRIDFVLNTFGVPAPRFVADVSPKV